MQKCDRRETFQPITALSESVVLPDMTTEKNWDDVQEIGIFYVLFSNGF
jgi:hypothetical protein